MLIEDDLSAAEIGLCCSKIFNSEQSFFVFLEKYVSQKDTLLTEMRKGLYFIIQKFIKVRKTWVLDYLEFIYVRWGVQWW